MPERFRALRDRVRDWANRDSEALPDSVIEDTMGWAADKAYRVLRVPPLENIVTYNADTLRANTFNSNNRTSSYTRLGIPGDLIEFIQLREVDEAGRTVRLFNEKTDIRTFRDIYAEKYNDFAFWTREAGNILYSPGFGNVGLNFGSTGVGNATSLELYYYRRLPALDAQYDRTLANYRLGLLQMADGTDIPADADYTQAQFDALPADVEGQEVPHWLRDENERIILFGALGECMAYLQEDDQAEKYGAIFYAEIQELNKEDQDRTGSGGNVQVNFNGRGLI